MNSKIKTIIIAVVVVIALVLVYIFLIKKSPEQAGLTSSTSAPSTTSSGTSTSAAADTPVDTGFLNNLLGIKNIQLNTSILQDNSFNSLHDSTVTLNPDGTEGRDNPFAPIGSDPVAPSISSSTVQNNLPANAISGLNSNGSVGNTSGAGLNTQKTN
ncbi:MAG: hypothetical protein WCI41_00675 [bacterium]